MESPLEHPLASIAQMSKPVKSGILEITSKLRESTIVPAIPFHKINPTDLIQSISALPIVSIGIDTTSIINAEEALEVPPIVPLELSTSLVADMNTPSPIDIDATAKISVEECIRPSDRRNIFQKIGEQEFEDVLFTPEQKPKKHNRLANNITLDLSDNVAFPDALKPERNLETIERDVKYKEKLLAEVLNFDLSDYMVCDRLHNNPEKNDQTVDLSGRYFELDCESEEFPEKSESIDDEDESYKTEIDKLRSLGECSKELLKSSTNDEFCSAKSNYIDIGIEPLTQKFTEAQFNVLSKDFVSSANSDEFEDWTFLDIE